MSTKAKEVAKIEQLPVAADPMQILAAAVERGVDADQLGKLMDLQERYQSNQARIAFSSAMAEFQARCPTILKSKKADRYSYAPLDEILRTIRPHLDACGLSIRFNTRTEGSNITALCAVSHRDGHTETSEFTCPVDPAMKVNDTQKVGSANSYAKRYALCNALNLVGSEFDDDGYAAGQHKPEETPASEEQRAYLEEFKEAGKIPPEKQRWLDARPHLTEEDAARMLTYLRKLDKSRAKR